MLPVKRLLRCTASAFRELTCNDRRYKERKQRYPVLWISDRPCVQRGQEEEIETGRRDARNNDRDSQSPRSRDDQYRQEEGERDCRRIHPQYEGVKSDD